MKLWATELHTCLLHADKPTIAMVHNMQHGTWTLLENNDKFQLVQRVRDTVLMFSVSPLLCSRSAVTYQDFISRNTSHVSASTSTPVFWRSASSQQREEPHYDQALRTLSCRAVTQNQDHEDSQQ